MDSAVSDEHARILLLAIRADAPDPLAPTDFRLSGWAGPVGPETAAAALRNVRRRSVVRWSWGRGTATIDVHPADAQTEVAAGMPVLLPFEIPHEELLLVAPGRYLRTSQQALRELGAVFPEFRLPAWTWGVPADGLIRALELPVAALEGATAVVLLGGRLATAASGTGHFTMPLRSDAGWQPA